MGKAEGNLLTAAGRRGWAGKGRGERAARGEEANQERAATREPRAGGFEARDVVRLSAAER